MIKVIGIGGGGCNAVNYMYNNFNTTNVDFILCNTDSQVLDSSNITTKVQLGINITEGLGAGGDIQVGQQATEASVDQIRELLDTKTKMVFIAAALGGGTGSGGAAVIAKLCKEMDILTVAIVTRPLSKGSKLQIDNANKAIEQLKQYADTLLIISNDKLVQHYGTQKMSEAFKQADDVLANAVQSIVSLITTKGYINVDFADVKKVMRKGSTGAFGMAKANGDNRALQAIEKAMTYPLLDCDNIYGARWALLNISTPIGEYEITFDDIQAIQEYIAQRTGENTEIKTGITYDETLENNVAVTVIATGFQEEGEKKKDINAEHDILEEQKQTIHAKKRDFFLLEGQDNNRVIKYSPHESQSTQTEFLFDEVTAENDIFLKEPILTPQEGTIDTHSESIFMDDVNQKEIAKFDEEDIFKNDVGTRIVIENLRKEIVEKSVIAQEKTNTTFHTSTPAPLPQNANKEKLRSMSFNIPGSDTFPSSREEIKSFKTQSLPSIFEESTPVSIRYNYPQYSSSVIEESGKIISRNKFLEGNQPD